MHVFYVGEERCLFTYLYLIMFVTSQNCTQAGFMCCSRSPGRRNRHWTPAGSICILVVCPCFNIRVPDNIRVSECRRSDELKHVIAIIKPTPTWRVPFSGCTPVCLYLPPLPSPSQSLSSRDIIACLISLL